MTSPRADLRAAVDRLSDDEVTELLAVAHEIERRRHDSTLLERLGTEPTFRVPEPRERAFARIEPIDALGIPASAVLIEDRR